MYILFSHIHFFFGQFIELKKVISQKNNQLAKDIFVLCNIMMQTLQSILSVDNNLSKKISYLTLRDGVLEVPRALRPFEERLGSKVKSSDPHRVQFLTELMAPSKMTNAHALYLTTVILLVLIPRQNYLC